MRTLAKLIQISMSLDVLMYLMYYHQCALSFICDEEGRHERRRDYGYSVFFLSHCVIIFQQPYWLMLLARVIIGIMIILIQMQYNYGKVR